MNESFRLTFITPQFSRGGYEDRAEIRPPSIRGQLHWWHRILTGDIAGERRIFGSVHGGTIASKVVVRVANVQGRTGTPYTLPHKHERQASPKAAFLPQSSFDLHVLSRRGEMEGRDLAAFLRTLEGWLNLGSLGLRITRGAGSFTWQPLHATIVPMTDFASFERRCRQLLQGGQVRFALLANSYGDAEDARKVVSDTLGGRDDGQGESDLERINHPLGRAFRGRKTSPLRFRIVGSNGEFRIAALWDDRTAVTGNRQEDLRAIIELLAQRKPELGRQLQESAILPP